MNLAAVDAIARAVLYEGFLLYPYRRSSVKNRQRWTFGALYPPAFSGQNSELSAMQTQCLVRGSEAARLEVRVRFLQLFEQSGAAVGEAPWQEAVEREVVLPEATLGALLDQPRTTAFRFDAAKVERTYALAPAIEGAVALSALPCGAGLFRLTARIRNQTPLPAGTERGDALLRAFVSTHTVLGVQAGEFVSQLDPPPDAQEAAAACENVGTWPVLAGARGARDTMLSSPIILYDHPAIAPESRGDLFDATEIDEILSLRILTLTDAEKREMREADPRARALLERTEALTPAELLSLHGALRGGDGVAPPRAGDRVRLRPRPGGDVFDLALAGKAATVASVERALDGDLFVAVTIDDDPGRDLGLEGKPGHRFFYRLDEVELLQ